MRRRVRRAVPRGILHRFIVKPAARRKDGGQKMLFVPAGVLNIVVRYSFNFTGNKFLTDIF